MVPMCLKFEHSISVGRRTRVCLHLCSDSIVLCLVAENRFGLIKNMKNPDYVSLRSIVCTYVCSQSEAWSRVL